MTDKISGDEVMRPDPRLPREADHPWHVAINVHSGAVGYESMRWMYAAKSMADEVPRLAMLFARERLGQLPAVHHQCSRDVQGAPVADNHLTCCLGVVCRECPHLLALDAVKRPDEERDVIKAWTCAAHILRTPDCDSSEGFALTEDDKMFWRNVYDSLATLPEK